MFDGPIDKSVTRGFSVSNSIQLDCKGIIIARNSTKQYVLLWCSINNESHTF